MKIGIMTFHRAANYGAVLQAYALQNYLSSMQNEVEIIDYRCKAIENVHSSLYFLHIKGLKNKAKQFLRWPVKLKKRKAFDKFLSRKIPLSIRVDKKNIRVLLGDKYDLVIAGSDQIWNPDLTKCDMAYLLDFVTGNTDKISYAASFGIETLDKRNAERFKKYLAGFNKLSVREQQGITILKNLCNKEAAETLDPTLLLKKEDWKRFMAVPKDKDFILLYMINYSDKLMHIARKMAETERKQLVFISDSMRRKRGIKYMTSVTPEEWTGLFYNAAYVVTNSFHGTAFSINFNKNVIIGLSSARQNGNTRITNLLDKLSIEYDCRSDTIDLGSDINWESVNSLLDELRESSYRFLQFADRKEPYEKSHIDDWRLPV